MPSTVCLQKFLSDRAKLSEVGSKLDLSIFRFEICVPCVWVKNACDISKIMLVLKPYLLRISKLAPVVHCENGERVIKFEVRSRGNFKSTWVSCQEILIDADLLKERNKSLDDELQDLTDSVEFAIRETSVKISYDNFTSEDALKVVLPDEASVSGYSHVGHIVHLNLAESQLPFKNIIGNHLNTMFADQNCTKFSSNSTGQSAKMSNGDQQEREHRK